MRLKTVALVSTNDQLARFFELELMMLPYRTERFWSAAELEDRFDCIIVDNDTVMDMRSGYRCPVINVSSYFEKTELSRSSYALPWPTPIRDLSEIFRYIESQDIVEVAGEHTLRESQNTVYVTDPGINLVMLENCHIRLTRSEFCVLQALCEARGEIVEREKLASLLGAAEGNITDVYVCRLRKKLEEPLGRRLIFAERGRGYRTVLVIKK